MLCSQPSKWTNHLPNQAFFLLFNNTECYIPLLYVPPAHVASSVQQILNDEVKFRLEIWVAERHMDGLPNKLVSLKFEIHNHRPAFQVKQISSNTPPAVPFRNTRSSQMILLLHHYTLTTQRPFAIKSPTVLTMTYKALCNRKKLSFVDILKGKQLAKLGCVEVTNRKDNYFLHPTDLILSLYLQHGRLAHKHNIMI